MGTLDEVLAECGWRKTPAADTWLPPVYRRLGEESVRIPVVRG